MEKLSKILIVVCVLFVVVGIYWMTSKYALTVLYGQGFFYVIMKYFYLKAHSFTSIIKSRNIQRIDRWRRRGFLYDDKTLVGFISSRNFEDARL